MINNYNLNFGGETKSQKQNTIVQNVQLGTVLRMLTEETFIPHVYHDCIFASDILVSFVDLRCKAQTVRRYFTIIIYRLG